MANVSALGSGSGMPLGDLLEKLMKVDPNQQLLDRLDKQEKGEQAKLSAYGQMKSALSKVQTAAQELANAKTLQLTRSVTSSDTNVVTATAAASAIPASYTIEVSRLAQQQKLVATGQVDKAAAINSGTLTFSFGAISGGSFSPVTGKYQGASFTAAGVPLTVVIGAQHTTLEDIRDAINSAASGKVSAAIINDGSSAPYRLILTSLQSGTAYSMRIAVSEDQASPTVGALAALLAHDPACSQALAETQAARNTELLIDGAVAVSQPTTQLSGIIDGVTLALKKTNVGSPATLTIGAQDLTVLTKATRTFVNAYNELVTLSAQLTKSQAAGTNSAAAREVAGGFKGPLAGDLTLRALTTQLRTLLAQTPVGGVSLLTLGFSFQKTGALTLDDAKLAQAIAADASSVQQQLVNGITPISAYLDELIKPGGLISITTEGVNKGLRLMDKQRDDYTARLAIARERMAKEFSALDSTVSKYQKLGGQLAQMIQQPTKGN